MTKQEKSALLERLVEKEEFVAAIKNAQSKQEVQDIFKGNGLEMTRNEIDTVVAIMEGEHAELSENELENVTGGVAAETVLGWAWSATKKLAKKAWNLGKKLANWEDGKR